MSKLWKCPQCSREHESKDDSIFSICQECLSEMKPGTIIILDELNEVLEK